MFEWDDTVAFDEEEQYVGRICRQEDPNQVLVDKVPQYYKQYQNQFLASTAEKLGPRQTFDHAISLKPEAETPIGTHIPNVSIQARHFG